MWKWTEVLVQRRSIAVRKQVRVPCASFLLRSSLTLLVIPGANVIVAGTAIFNAEAPQDVIHYLRTRVSEAQERIRAEREKADSSEPLGTPGEMKQAKEAMLHGGAITPMSVPRTYFAGGQSAGSEAPPAARANATVGAKP